MALDLLDENTGAGLWGFGFLWYRLLDVRRGVARRGEAWRGMAWTLVGLRDDMYGDLVGWECYEVTTWVDSIMCGERENWFDREKSLRSGRAQKSLETLNCEDMSNFSVVCLLLEVVSCLFFSFSGLWLK